MVSRCVVDGANQSFNICLAFCSFAMTMCLVRCVAMIFTHLPASMEVDDDDRIKDVWCV